MTGELNKAIFLDRDGVLNHSVYNPNTKEHEAPHRPEDFKLFDGVIESLKELQTLNYKLFVITNQPDYAKGKTTLENLKLVHERMHSIFIENKINFTEYYCCYHHPNGIIPEYTMVCKCRKPGNYFLNESKLKYSLDMANSWTIGDRDTDIYCGQSIGTKTILIIREYSKDKAGQSNPDYKANNLVEAVEIIKKKEKSYATN